MKHEKINDKTWLDFFKSPLGKEIILSIEEIRDEKIAKAMQFADSPYSPNEAMIANISQAKGIEDVLSYLKAQQAIALDNLGGKGMQEGM